MRKLFAFVIISLVMPLYLTAAKKDSAVNIPAPFHKNVIKINPTPMLLWSVKNLTLSYERVLNKRQSISIMIGYLEFPSLFKDNIANLVNITSKQKWGINLALEYRFYLMKRNARPVPDGIYIAPYASYYGFHFRNGLDLLRTDIDSAGQIKGNFYVFNLGVELGYQFVFWKRFTVDFVLIGPSLSYYGGGVNLTGNINLSHLKEYNEDFYNKLKEKYPMVTDFVINKSFKRDGKLDLLAVGFRYLIQFGFHF
ncbi:MAG: DUF3575 domain-containing protein [Bacteroidota bacterium]